MMSQDQEGNDPSRVPAVVLSDAETRATIYFAVGVTSESGNKAYMLAVAGDRASTPRLEPADNSGYSIGTIQTDLGQHYQPSDPRGENVPRDLVNAYQNWARLNQPTWVLSDGDISQTVSDLGRNGRQIKSEGGRSLDATVKSHLDTFLASEQGITWVHDRDVAQVDKIMASAMPALQQSDVYRNASLDDQVRLTVIVAKAYNQNEIRSATLIDGLQANRYANVSDVGAAVDGLASRRGDYFETGRDRALEGATVVNALRNADEVSPLKGAWGLARDYALTNPTRLAAQPDGTNLLHAYPVVRDLFVQYDRAPAFIASLDRGGTYAFGQIERGRADKFTGPGLFAAGDDFAVWNASGTGSARVGGEWQTIARNELVRSAGKRGVVDIGVSNGVTNVPLLHIDPSIPALRSVGRRVELEREDRAPDFRSDLVEMPKALYDHSALQPQRDALYLQAEAAMRKLDAGLGRDYDLQSQCMTASAACLAKSTGLARIDHIVLSVGNEHVRQGENLFVVEGALSDPAHHRAQMKTQEAITTPVEQSLANFQAIDQTQRQQQQIAIDERQHAARQMRIT